MIAINIKKRNYVVLCNIFVTSVDPVSFSRKKLVQCLYKHIPHINLPRSNVIQGQHGNIHTQQRT